MVSHVFPYNDCLQCVVKPGLGTVDVPGKPLVKSKA